MGKRDGMYFYNDWLVPFEKLEREQVGDLVIAMMRYFISGEEPPRFDGMLGMAADFIFPQIDRSMEYARIGSRGGSISKRTKEEKQPAAEKEPPVKSKAPAEKKAPEVVIEDVMIEEDEEEEDKPIFIDDYVFSEEMQKKLSKKLVEKKDEIYEAPESFEQQMFKKKVMEDYFERFWREYPKKVGRKPAFDAFMKLSPDRELLRKMLDGIESQKKSQQWQKEEGRFVPNPSNWIEGRRWEDEASSQSDASFETDDFFEAALGRTREKFFEIS